MTDLRVAMPKDFLPKYLCPYDETPLRYDADTDPETHETGAQCDTCGKHWIVFASSFLGDPNNGVRGSHVFSMREVTD